MITSRLFVQEQMPSVKKTDEEGNISVYCYTECADTDTDLVKNARGLVYEDDVLVVKSYPYTIEYEVEDDAGEIEKLLVMHKPKECVLYDSFEGFLIRTFYLHEKWFIATHRKLDAYKTRWSCTKTLGELFELAINSEYDTNSNFQQGVDANGTDETVLQRFMGTLDKTVCHTFLVLNNEENRLVCNPPSRPTLYFTGVFSMESSNPQLDFPSLVPSPPKKQFDFVDDIFAYVAKSDSAVQQGLVVFTPTTQFKIISKDYKYLQAIRGNEVSIRFRYLQLRMDKEKRGALAYLYPAMNEQFDLYENTIYLIAKHLKTAYINRYAHKDSTAIPPSNYYIIKQCHQWHCKDRENNRISIEYIIDILNEQTPLTLNKMVKEFLIPKNEEGIKATK